VRVLAEIWPQADGHLPLTPEMAWAMAHAGNYVALARRGDKTVGASLAFLGTDEDGLLLHSHMTGLKTAYQGSSFGYTLKQHQRTWALERGVDRVVWTFDPLVSRNAFFNVMKLGATVTDFYPDFYGPLSDDINAGDESDRCLVTWRLTDERAVAAADGRVPDADVAALLADGAVLVLSAGPEGQPQQESASGPVLLCRVPLDVVQLRRTDPACARAWRHALRSVLSGTLSDGYEIRAVTRDGCYVLSR
jgi:predicted GNAT superfamily acetyltransferase